MFIYFLYLKKVFCHFCTHKIDIKIFVQILIWWNIKSETPGFRKWFDSKGEKNKCFEIAYIDYSKKQNCKKMAYMDQFLQEAKLLQNCVDQFFQEAKL